MHASISLPACLPACLPVTHAICSMLSICRSVCCKFSPSPAAGDSTA
jgi:hypothetical protein